MWRISEGTYLCCQCGGRMISLFNDIDEIPLFCPFCYSKNRVQKFAAFVRSLAGERALLELQDYLL
jgi:late competence protein required for DNA uptake (superfamily II DNA/RNA helicase)